MIAGLEDFSPKDYEKVMAAVNKAKIELVDKLSKEDLEAANSEPKNVKKDAKPGASAGTCSEERSMISPDYARNFICDFIIGKSQPNICPTLFD